MGNDCSCMPVKSLQCSYQRKKNYCVQLKTEGIYVEISTARYKDNSINIDMILELKKKGRRLLFLRKQFKLRVLSQDNKGGGNNNIGTRI